MQIYSLNNLQSTKPSVYKISILQNLQSTKSRVHKTFLKTNKSYNL